MNVQKEYVLLMLLTAYRAAKILVNVLKDNNEMELLVMARMIERSKNNMLNI